MNKALKNHKRVFPYGNHGIPATWSTIRHCFGIPALVLAMAMLTWACTSTASNGIGRSTGPTLLHNAAPDIEFSVYSGQDVLGGETTRLSGLIGNPVVLNFWAGLCPPCRAEMGDLQKVYDQYKGRVVLLGLDVGPFTGLGSHSDGRALLQKLAITYPAGPPHNGKVVVNYRINGMPMTVFIKPDGSIFRMWTGALNTETLTSIIEELLAAS